MTAQVRMVIEPYRIKYLAFAAALACVAAPQPAAASAQLLFARGNWAALRFGARCEARSRPVSSSREGAPSGYAGIAFDSGPGVHGQVYVRLSRPPRAGSAVLLTVGSQPFLLFARGEWAWSRSREQSLEIIAAARVSADLRVESRDSSGRRFVDRYGLSDAPTAIDAAAAACAGKWR